MALVRRPTNRSGQGRPLARYGGLSDIVSQMDDLVNAFATGLGDMARVGVDYPIDLYETSDKLVLEMAVPGVKGDQLEISLAGRQLSIEGDLGRPGGSEERRYWLQGIPRGQFSRTVSLPTAVEPDRIKAEVHDGLLTLTLPKVAEARARKISIHAG